VLGYYCCLIFFLYRTYYINTLTFFNRQINVYEPFCTVITQFFYFFLPWTKTGTDPTSGDLTACAKPLSNVGQFVTELNVPTVLTQQAQQIGVAAIKNYGKSNTCILSFNL
jgi:hypothetical protein